MKFCLSILSLFVFQFAFAQSIYTEPDGGGEHVYEASDNCISEADRSAIIAELESNRAMLRERGDLPMTPSSAVAFDWPLKATTDLGYNDYWALINYVDQDTSAGIGDYNCGARSYNGHRGTDIITWPFPWYLVEEDYVEVIAGAAGTILSKRDGNDDDHCSCFGSWNAVYVEHSDGSVAWYGHMKKGSLTSKGVGDPVSKGEFLGVVASSGCSTAPHLHFEVYDDLGILIDPFMGTCNLLNASSWWASQNDYREPGLNAALTHDAVPVHGCPGVNEEPNFEDHFDPGDNAIFASYYHDQESGDLMTFRVRDPIGVVIHSWNYTVTATYSASWWYWTKMIPVSAEIGVWKFEVDYQGETEIHEFTVGVASDIVDIEKERPEVIPNPATNFVWVAGWSNSPVKVQVYNEIGELVLNGWSGSAGLDISSLIPGLYFLRSEDVTNTAPAYFVKQ